MLNRLFWLTCLFAFLLTTEPNGVWGAGELSAVKIETTSGSVLTGTIEAIDEQGIVSGAGLPANLKLDQILAVTTTKASEQPPAESIKLVVASGGVLFVSNPRIEDDSVVFESTLGLSRMSLQTLRGILWKESPKVEARILSPSTGKDSVFVETGDGEQMVEGIVEGLSADQLQINFRNQSRKIGIGKLNAIVMADLGIPVPEHSRATIRFTDGSELSGVIRSLLRGKLKLQILNSETVVVECRNLASISILSDRLQYLSDLEPVEVEQQTQFTVERTWQRDLSIERNRITIRGSQAGQRMGFAKGLGTQAYTRLTFANSNEFNRFMATVGIDLETRGRGDCQVSVLADGIEIWSRRIRGNDPAVDVDVDISNMKRITLVVAAGEEFDLADHVDWGKARFVKTK